MAEEELRSLAAAFRQRHPDDTWKNERVLSAPADALSGLLGRQPPLTAAFGLMSAFCVLILVVSCGNLGSLLVARGVARGHELGIRAAVGARRARLVRQLFTESLVLAMLGAAAGLGLGALLLRVLMRWSEAPSWVDPTPDWRVVVFAIGIGVLTALVFGLAPSRRAAADAVVRAEAAPSQYAATAIAALGVGALALACVGIVGLVAFTVAQRTKEIGLRIALGARPARVVLLVLRQFARPVGLGLIAGVGLAAALSQVLRRVLYGVSHLDPLAYGAAIILFLAAAALAAMWPAQRAARVDPWRALRHE